MAKLKIVETILSAVSALIAAGRAIIRFIGQVVKLKQEPATNTA